MRNDLNSVLIEGILFADPVVDESRGIPNVQLTIKSFRYETTKDGEREKIAQIFNIDVLDTYKPVFNLAENLKEGRKIRVVGRVFSELRRDQLGNLIPVWGIRADNIELKPYVENGQYVY